MIKIEINNGQLSKKLGEVLALLNDGRLLFQEIAGALESQTENNFEAQGRPAWVPLTATSKVQRLKRNRGGSTLKILQDRGILASSISTEYGPDYTLIGVGGAAKSYAAIHQFGGTIDKPAHSRKTRLRTTSKSGKLHKRGNLATFAKASHKNYRETWTEVPAHQINIPARPYLPFIAGNLQPEAEQTLLDIVNRLLGQTLTP